MRAVGVQVNEQFTTYTATDVAEGLQDFLICIEMFIAALAHAYAFPPRVSLQHTRFVLGVLGMQCGDTAVAVAALPRRLRQSCQCT
jgi:hypothetical protein